MRIVDSSGKELTAPNMEAGYLVADRILIAHHKAVEAKAATWHYETIATYKNGGRDIEKVIDTPAVPAREAWDEYEDVMRYVLYTTTEIAQKTISALKQHLADTDYITAKAVDAMASADSITALLSALKAIRAEYADTLEQRAAWRAEINRLEAEGNDA